MGELVSPMLVAIGTDVEELIADPGCVPWGGWKRLSGSWGKAFLLPSSVSSWTAWLTACRGAQETCLGCPSSLARRSCAAWMELWLIMSSHLSCLCSTMCSICL